MKLSTLPAAHWTLFHCCFRKGYWNFRWTTLHNPESWFQSRDTSWQTDYTFIHTTSRDHVSSATEAPLSRGWNFIHENLLWLTSVFSVFLKKSDNFSWTEDTNIYIQSDGTLLARSKFLKCSAYGNKNAFRVLLDINIRGFRTKGLWIEKLKTIISGTRSKWNGILKDWFS